MSENLEPTLRDMPPPEAGMPLGPSVDESDPRQLRAQIEDTRTDMSGTIDEIQGRLSPQHLRAQAVDTAKRTAMQARDTATQRLQQVASQVNEKARPVVQQATTQAQQQARMVRDKYNEIQERTGIEITPRMLGIAAGALAGLVALIALIQRLRGRNAEEEDEVIIAEITPATLSNGKYQITRIED